MAHSASKSKVEGMISGLGLGASFATELGKAFRTNGGNANDIYRFLNGDGQLTFQDVARLSMRPHRFEPLMEFTEVPYGGRIHILTVPVDARRSWTTRVRAAGDIRTWSKWGRLNPRILFPSLFGLGGAELSGVYRGFRQNFTVVLVDFKTYLPEFDVIEAWQKKNKLNDVAHELVLAIGEHFPLLNLTLGMKEQMTVLTLGGDRGAGIDGCRIVWQGEKRSVVREGVRGIPSRTWVAFIPAVS